jgi:type IV pilus biogenesis protein PilP
MLRRDHRVCALVAVMFFCSWSGAAQQEDERSYLIRRQSEIFRLNVETDYALALQKLCQTGYAEARLCPAASAKSAPPPASIGELAQVSPQQQGAPTHPASVKQSPATHLRLSEISGVAGHLVAILALEDGRTMTLSNDRESAHQTTLPGGLRLVAITSDQVQLRRADGSAMTLFLTGGESISDPAAIGQR